MNRLEEKSDIQQGQKTDRLEALQQALMSMATFAGQAEDEVQEAKFRDLAANVGHDCLHVAFCGHFSAGKSTLVNTLCGAALLPSSPIPTSANVVSIRDGEPAAVIHRADRDGHISQKQTVEIEQLAQYALDGADIVSIDVTYPVPLLGKQMAFFDTPGVDSTDDAHRAATESALHLADVVIYVTDYNHVLGDVNFRFLRTLAEWGKPTYVVVNQIDKHREAEVPFHSFRANIQASFASWGIKPAGMMFLSLKEPQHPLSDLEGLKSLLNQLQQLRVDLKVRSAMRSAQYLAEEFRKVLHARNRDERESLLAQAGVDEEAADEVRSARERLQQQLNAVQNEGAARKDAVRDALDPLLSSANLTPAQTREKAAAVLESMQPGFKVGLFAGKAKTEAERERRLALLAEDFNRQLAAQLDGHVRELLRKEAREAGWTGEELESSLEADIGMVVNASWLRERVKPGMGADGQATLHYAADLSADARAAYRRAALEWVERLTAKFAPQRAQEAAQLAAELDAIMQREEALATLTQWDEREREQSAALLALLPEAIMDADLALPAPGSVMPDEQTLTDSKPPQDVEPDGKTITDYKSRQYAEPDEHALTDGKLQQDVEPDEKVPTNAAHAAHNPPLAEAPYTLGAPGQVLDMLDRAATLLQPIPALAGASAALRKRAERLGERQFTIALFGAFSAGKSSFANALIGRAALPVSPNPTTATINRIVAPSSELADGSARIVMKSPDALLADIRHSLQRVGISDSEIAGAGDDANALLALAQQLPAEAVHPRGKPHLAFLQAAKVGWAAYGGKLGTRFVVDDSEYRRYAADEQASCFVAEIDLAVDAPLTRSGAVLVDTPGADSINARHTGVAFEYIRNADAVLFVTYYNHAFTAADRRFLQQLGGVKDAFELDKMFFIINAADLAASPEEREAVEEHVAAQLLKHGIRTPRLLAVSSREGLQAKLTGDRDGWASSGMAAFEASFRSFAETDLGALAAASARKELQRAGKQLESWLHAATADAQAREREARHAMEQARMWRQRASGEELAAVTQPLKQELSEQLYHLRQRVYYRFGEHFQAAFHPSVLRDDGRDLKKLLPACWDDLLRSVGEDLIQELRAAGLRLEKEMKKQMERQLSEASNEWAETGFSVQTVEQVDVAWPLQQPFEQGPRMESRKLWQSFRSPRYFFEQDGKKALQQSASDQLFATVDGWLGATQSQWLSAAESCYREQLRESYLRMAEELAAFAEHLGTTLQQPELAEQAENIRTQWAEICGEQ